MNPKPRSSTSPRPRSPRPLVALPLSPLLLLAALAGACAADDARPGPIGLDAAPGVDDGAGKVDDGAGESDAGGLAEPPPQEPPAEPPPGPAGNVLEVELESLASQSAFAPFVVESDDQASGGQYIVWPEAKAEQALSAASDVEPGRVEIGFNLSETADVQFQLRALFPNADDDSLYYSLDSGPWATQNNVPATDWESLTLANFSQLPAGPHSLRLQRREDGAQLDQVVLSASAGEIVYSPVEYPNAIAVDLTTEFQTIRGFGGMSTVWAVNGGALTPEQIDTAFGNETGQLGLSLYRVRIAPDRTTWAEEVGPAALAKEHGALVLAAPWTPPADMKTNNSLIGGSLEPASYGAYTDHLLAFATQMEEGGAALYAISLQNEPDIQVKYESCDWTPAQMASYLATQGPRFGELNVVAAESFNFDQGFTDPLLSDSEVEPHLDIVGGHIYGGGLQDYPLARSLGKEVWMTEHYTESDNSANLWPLALDVGRELHSSMAANFNAYVWWYIRRSYGLLTEDGAVSKRGQLLAQYSKFVRPGFVRVAATANPAQNVFATAYKNAEQVVVVVVNMANESRELTVTVPGASLGGYATYATSETKSVSNDGVVPVVEGAARLSLDGQSVTTLVSQAN